MPSKQVCVTEVHITDNPWHGNHAHCAMGKPPQHAHCTMGIRSCNKGTHNMISIRVLPFSQCKEKSL